MIYFDENFKKLIIPVSSDEKIAKIKVVNQACEYELEGFQVSYDKKHYVTVKFNTKVEMVDGQYDYKLINNEDVVFEEGILQYGDYKEDNKEYQIEHKQIVYEG